MSSFGRGFCGIWGFWIWRAGQGALVAAVGRLETGLAPADGGVDNGAKRARARDGRRSYGWFRCGSVIPAQAVIYAPQWTPVFAGATGPHPNHPKGNTTCRLASAERSGPAHRQRRSPRRQSARTCSRRRAACRRPSGNDWNCPGVVRFARCGARPEMGQDDAAQCHSGRPAHQRSSPIPPPRNAPPPG